MDFWDLINVVWIGIVEGITEWLPVSSTGHILLSQAILPLQSVSAEFLEMFKVVIQFGAIVAVIVMFWNKLWPFVGGKNNKLSSDGKRLLSRQNEQILPLNLAVKQAVAGVKNAFSKQEKTVVADVEEGDKKHAFYVKKDSLWMWWMVVVACIPTAILGLLLDDFLETYLNNAFVIACTLIVYGVFFIIIEIANQKRKPKMQEIKDFTWKTAFIIGLCQCLAMIPGTSRSGATILGALLIGVSRTAAAEYTFFLAIPTMFGASLLKIVKFFLQSATGMAWQEAVYLLVGMAVAFVVSLACIKFLMDFVRKHDFKVFGVYRIALGILVLVYFAFAGTLFNAI